MSKCIKMLKTLGSLECNYPLNPNRMGALSNPAKVFRFRGCRGPLVVVSPLSKLLRSGFGAWCLGIRATSLGATVGVWLSLIGVKFGALDIHHLLHKCYRIWAASNR